MNEMPWRTLADPFHVAERLVAAYEMWGDARYDESVSQSEHAAQTAALASTAGADDALVVAALLHDLGHVLAGVDDGTSPERDLRHENVAARFLAQWFGPEVTEPIRHHVTAKRYLCAVEPEYNEALSPASVRSLALQGGVLTTNEIDDFVRRPGAHAAIELRRWDDLAKDPDVDVPSVRSYLDTIAAVANRQTGA